MPQRFSKLLIIPASSLFLAVTACDQVDDLLDGRPDEVKVCEQFLIAKLKSPSSYSFLKYIMRDTKLTTEGFLKGHYPNLKTPWERHQSERFEKDRNMIEIRASGATSPVERFIVIDYEASNSFGAQIKGAEYCLFLSSNGEPLEIKEWQINFWVTFAGLGETECCILRDEDIR